ncbi:MAG: hypothetical protein P8106_05555 [Gammaproteobacteria bacterium]
MAETASQAGFRSLIAWYQCPVCGNGRLHAQPLRQPPLSAAAPEIYARTLRVHGGL